MLRCAAWGKASIMAKRIRLMICELFSLLVVFLREILLWTVDVGKLIMACGWVVGAIV